MVFLRGLGYFVVLLSCFLAVGSAQTPDRSAAPTNSLVYLDVVVTSKSGLPVSGLEQADFSVLDNKKPVAFNSFQALENEPQVDVVLVVDAVNTGFSNVAFERSEIDKFLRANGGHLTYPTALAILTDDGLQPQCFSSTDGNELRTFFDNQDIGLRLLRRGHTIDDPYERFQISLTALFQIINVEARHPGRKMILWISPGWPLLSDPEDELFLDTKARNYIFDNAVRLSTALRQGRITLYSIDPLGSADFAGRAIAWQAFVKGVDNANNAEWGNLALQVLATQSGGRAFVVGNDVAADLQQCIAETKSYYEISFAPTLDRKRSRYHSVRVRVAKPGLVARTRQGYYVEP